MKILYVTGHLRDADFIEHELHRLLPESRLDVSPTIEDAVHRLSVPDQYDAILVDAILPDGDAPRLATHIRQLALPVAVIVLIGTNDQNPPLRALEAGADDYLVKRQNYVNHLPTILRGTVERYRPPSDQRRRAFEVLYAGDVEAVSEQVKDPSQLRLDPARFRPDGSLEQLEGVSVEQIPYDVIVIDDTLAGLHVLRVLKDVGVRAPEVPVVLLLAPGNENVAVQALKMGADDCIIKTGTYQDRVLLTIRRVIDQRNLAREKTALHTTEGRLRLVLETVPACITVLACDGTFQAMNWSGLSIMGAGRIDQIVGKNIRDFVAPGQERDVVKFLERICAGERGTIQLECEGLDKARRRLELRAVPLKRDSDARVTVLAAILDVSQIAKTPEPAAGGETEYPQTDQVLKQAEEYRRRSTDAPPGEGDAAAQERYLTQRRLEAFERALRAASARHAQLAEDHRRERERWEGIKYELEQQKGIAEEKAGTLERQISIIKAREDETQAHLRELKVRLEAAEADLAGAAETAEARRALLDQEQWQAQQRLTNLEKELAEERTKLELTERAFGSAESARTELVEENRRMRSQIDDARLETERGAAERAALQEALRSAESGQADLLEDLERERVRGEEARQESEKQRGSLAEALETVQASLARQAEEHQAERARLQQDRLELEQQRASLAESLSATQVRLAQLTEESRSEMARLKQAAERLEQERASDEEALRAAGARLRQEAEEYQSELARRDQVRLQAEQQRTALGEALKAAKARLAQEMEQHRADQAVLERYRQELGGQRAALEEVRKAAEARLAQQADEHRAELARLEHLREEAEQQGASLGAALKAAEAQMAQGVEGQRAERARLEQSLQEFGQQHASFEETRKASEAALARQAQELRAERGDLERARGEWEQQRASLEEALRTAEARLAQKTEEHQAERARLEQSRLELDQQRVRLDGELKAAEARLAQQAREYEVERARLEQSRQDLRQRNAFLEEGVKAAKAGVAQQVEEYQVELARMEESRREWEQRQASLEESLQIAEIRLAKQVEDYQAERTRLEQALSSAEARLRQQADENQAERERLAEARREAERLRASLEQALKAAEAERARQVEEHQAERELVEQSRRELEQRRAALEEELGTTQMQQRELIGEQAARLVELEREHADQAEQYRAAEEQTKTLQAELQAAREREAQVLARHRSELDEYDSLVSRLQLQIKEGEEKRAALEEACRSAESGLSQIVQYQAEIAGLERAQQESEAQRAAAAEAVRALETQVSNQAAELRGRIEQADLLGKELDQQKAARSALEGALRTADLHRTQLLEEGQSIRAQLEKTQQELEQQRSARLALEDACRAAEATRAQLTERQHIERSQLEEAQRERDQYRVERERLRRLLAETSGRYQSLLKQRSGHFQQLLRDTVARCQQDAESQLRLMTTQHLEERETLEQLLKEVEARQQQLDEQAMSERRGLEARLAEIQAQYRRLLEYGFAAVAVTSLDGRLLNCSDAFARMFGYANSRAALVRPEEWQTRFVTDHGVLEARLKSEGKLTNAESCVRSADGRVVWIMENAMVVPSPGDETPVVERVFLDVTERHHLKEELRRSRRTESVGKLATATVQTFNDLLTSMSGYSQLLIEGLGEGDPRRKNAERVRKVASQAGSLARQLLAYARRQERPPDLLDLNLVVRRVEDLLHTLVGEDIEFTMTLAPDLGMVSADRAEMEQVITAFVVNARDALPLGGSVTMETSNTLIDMTEAGRPPEPYVLLAVSASGYGVLPIVCPPSIDAIITRYGGHLRAMNEPERVAILRLYLPRIEPAERPEDAARHTGAELEED